MIEFSHVFKSYGRGLNALADASFQVDAGEFVYVSGPSGAGKSTLLKLVAGLVPASRGRIQVNGQDLGKLTGRARPYLRRAVGVILQDTHLLNDRSAFENVMLPLIVTGHEPALAQTRARAAIEKVGLAGKETRRPVELSGGDQQRLAIARAIVNRPALLIADEPTANLDHASAKRIIEVFRDFNRVGVTMLIATHDRALLAEHTHRVLHVENGRVRNEPGQLAARAREARGRA
ncbi:ATP-binding cassette domain-containing protein [Verticiella sediminum]|uniref:Cell division ATP-binding protein FtsE n=1 Tax=Verticiella sediminum TaxID=1247510 RepID=A0A556B034_9BURK|nr:ATP-binding cassette domain-containing protein [Verticiella sediminum]TSH98533.1 ATP-binding cassette domain-containing protein [Verticiella sediminum]